MRKEYTRVQYNDKGEKQCTNCREYKETLHFHKYSKAQDKLKPWCKNCVKEYDIKEGDATRIFPRKLNEDGDIHCRNCGGYFKEDEMKQSSGGMYKGLSYCLTCAPLLRHIKNVKRYGITLEQYHQMLLDQNYSCKVCNLKESTFRKRLSIDHDHGCCPGEGSCGKCVRGLLCHHCNAALGNAKDNIETLQKMIDYLKK
jgi:hypothetical protein